MKKLAQLAILSLSLMLPTFASAGGIWDMVKNSSSAGTLNSKQYTIEVSGTDVRAYVIHVPEMNSICFITYSSKGTPAMACKTEREMAKLDQ